MSSDSSAVAQDVAAGLSVADAVRLASSTPDVDAAAGTAGVGAAGVGGGVVGTAADTEDKARNTTITDGDSKNDSVTPHDLSAVQPAQTVVEFGSLEVDTDTDRGSAFDDDYESITTSVTSTATDYKFENGRRYHAYGEEKYPLPNDDDEVLRLELQHRIWQLSLHDRLFLAPIPKTLRNALDIGCGTGAWVIDFAEDHPDTRVIGTDLSPIQPTMVPPNVEFLVDDITSPWVFDHKFDYIHSRAITVGVRDWKKLVDQVWENLEPGGWVEFQEYHAPFACDDGTMENCPDFKEWNHAVDEAAGKAGTKLDAILSVPDILEKRGFIKPGTASTKWPLGQWAKGKREKRVGDLFGKDISGSIEGVSMRLLTKVLGLKSEDVSALCQRAAADIRSGRMHTYMPIDLLWAQKPVDA